MGCGEVGIKSRSGVEKWRGAQVLSDCKIHRELDQMVWGQCRSFLGRGDRIRHQRRERKETMPQKESNDKMLYAFNANDVFEVYSPPRVTQ